MQCKCNLSVIRYDRDRTHDTIFIGNLMVADSPMPQLSNNQLKKLADAEMKSSSTVEQLIKKTKEDSTKGAEEWEREYAARKEAALASTFSI